MISSIRWILVCGILMTVNVVVILLGSGLSVGLSVMGAVSCLICLILHMMEIQYRFRLIKEAVIYAEQMGDPIPELAFVVADSSTIHEWTEEGRKRLEAAKQLVDMCSTK